MNKHDERERLFAEWDAERLQPAIGFYSDVIRGVGLVILALLLLAVMGVIAQGADALAVVNKQRAARGLPAFQRDDGLSIAAEKCAQYRAARGMEGHTSNDFAFVPKGSQASAAGCAAWEEGFGSCCMYERWRYAGAAWVRKNGRNYCHLYVR